MKWIANWINVWTMRFGLWKSPSLVLTNINPWDCRPVVTNSTGLGWNPNLAPRWPLNVLRWLFYKSQGWEKTRRFGSRLTLSLGILDQTIYYHPDLPDKVFYTLADMGRADKKGRAL